MSSFVPFISARALILTLISAVIFLLLASWAIVVDHRASLRQAGDAAFEVAVSHHELKTSKQQISYTATTGYLPAIDRSNKVDPYIYYTAYTINSDKERPLTFVFNGGPGSSSIWLHMGAFGPVRTEVDSVGYHMNPDTWLPFTDLVFVDPVGTGYSRASDAADERRFHNYRADVSSIAGFIQAYLQLNHRVGASLYLAGESYGAARAVGLAQVLADSLSIPVSGLTLISPALNYELLSFRKGNQASYAAYLPTYALTAQYHHRLPDDLRSISPDSLLMVARRFADGTYREFLRSGQPVTKVMADSLSYFTGLDTTLLIRTNGRIADLQFTGNLLQGHRVGTYDSRAISEDLHTDPSEYKLRKAFPPAFKAYVHQQLRYCTRLPYRVTMNFKDWSFDGGDHSPYFNVTKTLIQLLTRHPVLKIQVACGVYDLATPVSANLQIVQQIKRAVHANITMRTYPAGHMLYTNNEVNRTFCEDSERFYSSQDW